MRATVVTLAETGAAGTLAPRDFIGPGPRACCLCGLSPADVRQARRPNPSLALLEPTTPDPRDPLLRSRYRCRNRAACAARGGTPGPDPASTEGGAG